MTKHSPFHFVDQDALLKASRDLVTTSRHLAEHCNMTRADAASLRAQAREICSNTFGSTDDPTHDA